MARRFVSCLLGGALAVCLLAAGPNPTLATAVIDDHFTGNSGGMPANWVLFTGPGTVVESGTTVTLDHDIMIRTVPTFDPSAGTVTVTWDIAEMSPRIYSVTLGLADLSFTNIIGFGISPSHPLVGVGVNTVASGRTTPLAR